MVILSLKGSLRNQKLFFYGIAAKNNNNNNKTSLLEEPFIFKIV